MNKGKNKESSNYNYNTCKYKCGELSKIVIASLKKGLQKIKSGGIKNALKSFLPGVDPDDFVLQKIRNQLKKRRAIELKKSMGRVDIQYRRGGIQIEPVGLLRIFVKKITITDSQILQSFDDIISQIENRYIQDDNYIISKIDDIIFELSKTGIYRPKNSEEKTLYDFAMIILASYYNGSDRTPPWILCAIDNLSSGEFIKKWLEFLAEYVSDVITQVSENIFFDFKFIFDSIFLRSFLNQKTNKGQLSKLIKMFGIDIESIIRGFVKSYVSPSFLRGAGDIIADITCGFLSDSNLNNEISNSKKIKDMNGIIDLTVTLSKSGNNGRRFRWYCKNNMEFKLECSYDPNFKERFFAKVETQKVSKTFPKINFGLISSYGVCEMFKYSAALEDLELGILYYRIVCKDYQTEIYKLNIKKLSKDSLKKTKFLVFADSQGMVKSDYDKFLGILENAVAKNKDADFIVHLGDFVNDGNNEDYWKWILSSNVWAENAVLAMSGNHEAGRNIVAYNAGVEHSVLAHFNLPVVCKQNLNMGGYYSVVYDDITFIILNTNTGGEYGLDESQYNWAIELAKNAKTKWKVLCAHKSPYSNGPHHKDIDVKLIGKQIEDIAYYGKIDLILGGHDHVYARTAVLAQGRKIFASKNNTDNMCDSYFKPNGTIYVASGTSGVKNYSQHFPVGFPAQKLLDLDKPMYSCVEISNETLSFNAYTFDENSERFSKIDSFEIVKSENDNNVSNAEYFDNLISSIPDIPWKSHKEQIAKAKKIYLRMSCSEKKKIKNHSKFLKAAYIDDCYGKIIKGKTVKVHNLNEFLDAINDKNIGTIDVDCDEINFEKKNLSKKKIFVNHPVRILGNGKIAHARFVLMPKSFLIVGGSVCIDNTRKPYSMHIAKSIFEMHDDTVFSLIDDATINNGYGIGYGGYAIDAKGKNTSVYLASSGHNFTGSGIVFASDSTSKVEVISGKYISNSRRYTFDLSGKINISSGFIRSLRINGGGKGKINGGTIGDSHRISSVYPLECSGEVQIFSGTINAHKGVSVKINSGAEVIAHKNSNCVIDVKGKILYN